MKSQDQKTGKMPLNGLESKNKKLFSNAKISDYDHLEFRFEIKDNFLDFVHKMINKVKSKKESPYIVKNYKKENDILTFNLHRDGMSQYDTVRIDKNQIEILTGIDSTDTDSKGKGHYYITNCIKGCTVEYAGPLFRGYDEYGLRISSITDDVLPNLSYREGSLQAKFVNKDGVASEYIDTEIVSFLLAKYGRQLGIPKDPSEMYTPGYPKKKSSEIIFEENVEALKDWIDPISKYRIHTTEQYRKNATAQENFKHGYGKFGSFKLKELRAHLDNHSKQNEKIHDDVKDGIAKTKESGYKHISRTATSKKGGREE